MQPQHISLTPLHDSLKEKARAKAGHHLQALALTCIIVGGGVSTIAILSLGPAFNLGIPTAVGAILWALFYFLGGGRNNQFNTWYHYIAFAVVGSLVGLILSLLLSITIVAVFVST